jgi:hypothetical protein
MGIDREAWISAAYNVAELEANGLPVETRWNSHLLANWYQPDYWLDPQGKDFGENAKYLQFNLQEAKKLLAAAGYPNGFNVTSSYSVERLNFAPTAEPIDGMLRELGLNIKVNTPNYANDYIPNYRDGHGQYEGYAYATVLGAFPEHPSGGLAGRGVLAEGRRRLQGLQCKRLQRQVRRSEAQLDAGEGASGVRRQSFEEPATRHPALPRQVDVGSKHAWRRDFLQDRMAGRAQQRRVEADAAGRLLAVGSVPALA